MHRASLLMASLSLLAPSSIAAPIVFQQPAATPSPPVPVRVGGAIRVPQKVRDVRPPYPAAAQDALVRGPVDVEITIDATGSVSNAVVVHSVPLLDQAALDAVRQWKFTPTLVEGKPVAVIATVTVSFSPQAPPAARRTMGWTPDAATLAEMAAQLARDRGLSTQQVKELEDGLKDGPEGPLARSLRFGYVAQLVEEGRGLPAQQAKELEDRLRDSPEDLPARAHLLGYYFTSSSAVAGPDATHAARRRHILWVVEHYPEHEITILPQFTIDPAGHRLADAEGYGQAKKLWLEQIDRRKGDVRVLVHAARFFRLPDKALALSCLKQAVQIAPHDNEAAAQLGYTYAITVLGITMLNNNGLPMSADPAQAAGEVAQTAADELRASSNPAVILAAGSTLATWGGMIETITNGAIRRDAFTELLLNRAQALDPTTAGPARALCEFYGSGVIRAKSPEERKALARRQLEQAELVVDRTKGNPALYVDALLTASKAAAEARSFDKARHLATELLEQVPDQRDRRYGQAIHDGHIVLGRVSLNDGDIEQAKAHLLQAGRTPGGGSLTSFGPNMSLAKQLADRGERDIVITYLELCRSFWPRPQLEEWIHTLREGKTPNFGANLKY